MITKKGLSIVEHHPDPVQPPILDLGLAASAAQDVLWRPLPPKPKEDGWCQGPTSSQASLQNAWWIFANGPSVMVSYSDNKS